MHRLAVVVLATLVALSLSAATFRLPTDAELAGRADAVVVATVLDSAPGQAADGTIVTDASLRVEEVLKGSAAATVTVRELGGFVSGRGMIIAGSARYEKGTRVLAFLRQRDDGTYYTAFMSLGQYRFEGDLLVRDAHGAEALDGDVHDAREAAAFLTALRTGGSFERAPRVAANAKPVTNAGPPSSYVFNAGSPVRPIRWPGCESACFITYDHKGTQPGGANVLLAIDDAADAWTDDPNSFVFLNRGGVSSKVFNPATDDGENTIYFNHTGALPAFCDGSLGCGVVWVVSTTHNFRSTTWYSAFEGDVIVLPGSHNQTSLETLLGHEIGHTLSFIDAPLANNLMSGSINLNRGAVLGSWDLEALAQVYGVGVACTPVTITNVSGGGNVAFGSTTTLSVTATGDAPLTYQWFEGPSGTTTTPVGTNSPNFTTPAITAARQYWVRVSNACPSTANSGTITVTPTSCDAPVITNQPNSQNISPGASTTLFASVSGTAPFTWQWYRANTVGDTSNPVGTNSPSFTTPPLTTTTSYWARVSNACGSANSVLATITVGTQCTKPSITSQPTTVNLALGQSTALIVTATGNAPLTYQWFEGNSGDTSKPIAGQTGSSYLAGPFNTAGAFRYWVQVTNSCGSTPSQTITVNVACPNLTVPLIAVPAISLSVIPYTVSWSGNTSVTPTFELQEATDVLFSQNVRTFTVSGLSHPIPAHNEVREETRFFYRVRAISACNGERTDWSAPSSTVITPPLPENSSSFVVSVPAGTTQSFTQNLLVPGFGASATNADTFSIAIDVPWMTVFPASGALSAGGTTVQLTINPSLLEVGSTTATITLQRTNGSAATVGANATTTTTSTVPFSLSLVTPVSPDPRDIGPPPGTLIVPAVAHAQGIGSPFRSDVRIVNVSFEDIEYEISFTQSETDGTQSAKKTTLTIGAGDTIAFDDIVKAWFGAGTLGEGGIGTIEIRPLGGANPAATYASSRTYALDGGGTLGQFIPALRVEQFVGDIARDSLGRISLQQIANSAAYRTNVGFVEGSGQPVTFLARLLDGTGRELARTTRTLPPFGHLQKSIPILFGDVGLSDGRVEVEVTSPGGKVSAYASVVNNPTSDPLLVFPVQPLRTTAPRYVLAGIAEFEAPDRNFHSDMRVFNAGAAPVTVTLWYYDRGQSTPHPNAPPRQITLAQGEVRAINNVLPTLWPGLIGGGSIVALAPETSSLVLSAQTYSRQTDGGTKGQFIPGVTFREATGFGERALEVLQLEQSAQYRSNVGIVEVTGQPADVELTMYEPDSKLTAVVTYNLKANEYIQFDAILERFGRLGTVYNGRVSVKVIGGAGRVYAYGSTVDNRTEDPTYVPGQ